MKTVVCPFCGFGCRLLVDEKSMRAKPYPGQPNRGKLCPKGLYSLEFIRSQGRLKMPLKRVGSAMVPIS